MRSRIEVLWKWRYQPEHRHQAFARGRSLRSVGELARFDHGSAQPPGGSVRGQPDVARICGAAASDGLRSRARALQETGLLRLPEECPWMLEELLSEP